MKTPTWIEGNAAFNRNYRVWTHNPTLYKVAFYELQPNITSTWDTECFETLDQAQAAGERWIKVGWSYYNKEAQE